MSPVVALAVVFVAVLAAAVVAEELVFVLLPHAARTNAPKLAAPAVPAIFKNRLRSTSSRTKRSTIPAGCGGDSSPALLCSLVVLDIFLPPLRNQWSPRAHRPHCSCHLFAASVEMDHYLRRKLCHQRPVDGARLTQNGADSRNLPRDDAVATSTAVLLDEFRRRDSREHLTGGVGHVERTFRCDVVAGRFVQ